MLFAVIPEAVVQLRNSVCGESRELALLDGIESSHALAEQRAPISWLRTTTQRSDDGLVGHTTLIAILPDHHEDITTILAHL